MHITINDRTYDVEKLPKEAQVIVGSMTVVQKQLEIYQVASTAYSQELSKYLVAEAIVAESTDESE